MKSQKQQRREVLDTLLERATQQVGGVFAALVGKDVNDRSVTFAAKPGHGIIFDTIDQLPEDALLAVIRGSKAMHDLPREIAAAGVTWLRSWPAQPGTSVTKFLIVIGASSHCIEDDGTVAAIACAAGSLAITGGDSALEAQALNHAATGITIADINAANEPLIHVNDTFLAMTGYDRSEVIGRTCNFLQGNDRDQSARKELRAAIDGRRETTVRMRNYRKDGALFWNDVHLAPLVDEEGHVTHYVGVQTDVTDNVNLVERLHKERQQFRQIIQSSPNGIVVTDEEGSIRFTNDKAREMLCKNLDELVAAVLDVAKQSSATFDITIMSAAAPSGDTGVAEVQVWHTDWEGAPAWVAVIHDVTASRHGEQALRRMAETDLLTGLANRRRLGSCLADALVQGYRDGHYVGLVMLDVDRFKQINDSLGHSVGDQFLVQMARRLEYTLRDSDLIARLGGDEFAILIDRAPNRDAISGVATKILNALKQPLEVEGRFMRARASLGISIFPEHAQTTLGMMQHADAAMYEAKADGGATASLYHHALTERAERRLELDQLLANAFTECEFVIHYQRQVRLTEGHALAGLEALVRWHHPERGFVAPSAFMDALEDLGLTGQLTDYVLDSVCADIAAWGPLLPFNAPVAINVTARELHDSQFSHRLARILAQHGIDPQRITLELTESAAASNIKRTTQTLNELRALGTRIALDDFGTGFSALNYLRILPIDTVKIDRDFTFNITNDAASLELMRGLVDIIHRLGMDVIAEGVERPEQCEYLRNVGCDYAQGFFFAAPVPTHELELATTIA